MLRFIDFSITMEGLHRAGQDDWDAHAKRFENRIIRSGARLSTFDYEISDYYKDKILPTDLDLKELGLPIPEKIGHGGKTYVKRVNGYIEEGCAEDGVTGMRKYMATKRGASVSVA